METSLHIKIGNNLESKNFYKDDLPSRKTPKLLFGDVGRVERLYVFASIGVSSLRRVPPIAKC